MSTEIAITKQTLTKMYTNFSEELKNKLDLVSGNYATLETLIRYRKQ